MTKKQLKGKTFPFSITREDYMNSSRKFEDPENCPFAQAFKRQFPIFKNFEVSISYISFKQMELIAEIKNRFDESKYELLKKYGKHFHTTITFF